MDNGKFTGVFFLDLKKAFDTVDHTRVCAKLKLLGFQDKEVLWFTAYLENKNQVVWYLNTVSNNDSLSVGVPQGSILGPLLFIMYINDPPDIINYCKIVLYADDTAIFCTAKSVKVIESKLNVNMNKVNSWLDENRLTLNVTKTKVNMAQIKIRISKYMFLNSLEHHPLVSRLRSYVTPLSESGLPD